MTLLYPDVAFQESHTLNDTDDDNYWASENGGLAKFADGPSQLPAEPSVNCSGDGAGNVFDLGLGVADIGSTGLLLSPSIITDEIFQFFERQSGVTYGADIHAISASYNAFEADPLGTMPRIPIKTCQHGEQLFYNGTTLPNSLPSAEATMDFVSGSVPAVSIGTFQVDPASIDDPWRYPIVSAGEFPNVVAIPRNLPNTNATRTNPDGCRIQCDFSGCTASFVRAHDFRRHRAKHSGQNRPCPVSGCPRNYYRRDKLSSHLLYGHKLEKSTVDELCSAWQGGTRRSV